MTKYIGMDIHSSTSSFCVVNDAGEILDQREIVSNGRLLVDCIIFGVHLGVYRPLKPGNTG